MPKRKAVEKKPAILLADGFIRQAQLLELLPFSAATLWRMVRAGTFPQPVKLGPRITAWKSEAVRAFIDAAQSPNSAGSPVRRSAHAAAAPTPAKSKPARRVREVA